MPPDFIINLLQYELFSPLKILKKYFFWLSDIFNIILRLEDFPLIEKVSFQIQELSGGKTDSRRKNRTRMWMILEELKSRKS